MNAEAPNVSANQAIINELQQQATSPEDQAYLSQLQDEHNAARERMGMPAEDPALQQIAQPKGKEYQVDGSGVVHFDAKPGETGQPYDDGRRA